jgi:hypothetical protein
VSQKQSSGGKNSCKKDWQVDELEFWIASN